MINEKNSYYGAKKRIKISRESKLYKNIYIKKLYTQSK